MPSFLMRTTSVLLRLLRGKKYQVSAAAFGARFEGRACPMPPPVPRVLKARCQVREREVAGRPVFTFHPKRSASRAHVIYTHGGAYVSTLLRIHWGVVRQLVERTGATVTVPLYPLAPEHAYPAAYAMLARVYQEVTASAPAAHVVLCGDSAGGGLALGQALHYRENGLPLPGRIILFSPWLDISLSNPDVPALEKVDVLLARPGLIQAGKWWSGGDDPRTPSLSPIFGDLSGLPPIDVFQGTHDIFYADARRLAAKVTGAGGTLNLHEYAGAFHAFVGATFTPEARDAFEKVGRAVAAL